MTLAMTTGTAARGAMRVDDALPKALDAVELRRALNLSERTFFRYRKAGKFDRFLLPRAIGRKKYSGRLVQQYLEGKR